MKSSLKEFNSIEDLLDITEEILAALNYCVLYSDNQKKVIEICKKAINKAEGNN